MGFAGQISWLTFSEFVCILGLHFKKVLDDLQRMESSAGDYLNSNMNTIDAKTVTPDGIRAAQRLFVSVTELGDCLLSLAPDKSNRGSRNSGEDDIDDDASQESDINGRRKALVAQGMDSVKAAINGILETIDPPPLHTIFGLDVLRGSSLRKCISGMLMNDNE